jgi:hypothetical protein
MHGRIAQTFASLGRRNFIGQLSASSAALVSGAIGFAAKDVEAHAERLTMAPATLGREWDITSYRVRHSGRGEAVTRIVAVLLDRSGRRLGEFVRTRRYRIEKFPYSKTESGVVERYRLDKSFLAIEEIQLAWGNETIEITSSSPDGTFDVKYGGRHLGRAKMTHDRPEISPSVADILRYRPELVRLAAAVGDDLDRAFPEPPRDSETCCCDSTCGGSDHSCGSTGILRSSACSGAQSCVGSRCWNQYCIGCCSMSDCNCACVPDTDFFCYCVAVGTSCSCQTHCI